LGVAFLGVRLRFGDIFSTTGGGWKRGLKGENKPERCLLGCSWESDEGAFDDDVVVVVDGGGVAATVV
jgi:hypothetical protein